MTKSSLLGLALALFVCYCVIIHDSVAGEAKCVCGKLQIDNSTVLRKLVRDMYIIESCGALNDPYLVTNTGTSSSSKHIKYEVLHQCGEARLSLNFIFILEFKTNFTFVIAHTIDTKIKTLTMYVVITSF